MAKIKIEFDGFEKMIKQLEEMEVAVEPAIEKALKESFRVITPGIEQAIRPHKESGLTESSLEKNPVVLWNGNEASIDVGFRIHKGGIASQFLLYGAKASATGTPYRPPDMQLWDSIFGSETTKKVHEVQEDVFLKEIEKYTSKR